MHWAPGPPIAASDGTLERSLGVAGHPKPTGGFARQHGGAPDDAEDHSGAEIPEMRRAPCPIELVDDYSRESLAMVADTLLSGNRVARELDLTITFLSERLAFTGDTDDALSRLQLQLMGAFAKFERNIIRKRQTEGIAKAKARGVYQGRKKTVDEAKILDLNQQGKRVSEIAAALGVSRMTVYRALADV